MRGHIAKKANRYYVVIDDGPDPGTGKRRRRWHPAGDNRRDAERLCASLVQRKHDGTYHPPERIALADYLLERWLPSKRTRVKPTTASAYEGIIRLHIAPYIGRISLQKLRPEDLDDLYVRLLADGKHTDNGGLSAKSVRNVHAALQSALSDAARRGIVTHNVADIAAPPSISRNRRAMTVWNAQYLRTFLDAVADHDLYALFWLAASTGMRRGELAGLRWSDVDLDAARLIVQRQIVSVEYQMIETDLKTAASRRTIDLDAGTVTVLRSHRRQQLERQMLTGNRHDEGLVFATTDGTPTHPDLISKTFNRIVARLDVPRIRLHDLRHTHATLLLQGGVNPKVVTERLGHANVAFTMSVYQHVIPGMQAAAANMFGATVLGEPQPRPGPTTAPGDPEPTSPPAIPEHDQRAQTRSATT